MNTKGFSLIEVLMAISVLALFVTAFIGSLVFGQQSTAIAGARTRAVLLAEEGIEATRNIRDAGFVNLTDGTHGLVLTSNQWTFSGSSDTTNEYTRQITVTPVDANRKSITSTVTWMQNAQRPGSVSLTTYLTNWTTTIPVNACNIYCLLLGTYSAGTCRINARQCTNNGETYESGGNIYCTIGNDKTCCCLP